jgi:peroxiredoxin
MMRRREFFTIPAAAALLAPMATAAATPRPAPELEFISHSGERIKLGNYKGKKAVLIEYLLTTCPHCQKTAEMLSTIQSQYGAKGLQVLGIAINAEARQQLPDFSVKYARNFPVGITDHDQAASFLQHSSMMPMLMPQLVFIDRKGIIVEQVGGDNAKWYENQEKNLRADVEKLVQGGGGATKVSRAIPAKAKTKAPAK